MSDAYTIGDAVKKMELGPDHGRKGRLKKRAP
jgi:hypothetical protein